MIFLKYLEKNLARYEFENNFIWTVKIIMFKLVAKMFKTFFSLVKRVHNYFDGSTKLFSDLYLIKFLDTLAKSFFPCTKLCN